MRGSSFLWAAMNSFVSWLSMVCLCVVSVLVEDYKCADDSRYPAAKSEYENYKK